MNGFVLMNSGNNKVIYEFENGVIDSDGLRANYRVTNEKNANFTQTKGFFAWKGYGSPDWYILVLSFVP